MIGRGSWIAAMGCGLLVLACHGHAMAFPIDGDHTALPARTELNEDALDKPSEVFRSELAGGKS